MDGIAEIYHASPYSPLSNFNQVHDCEMATHFEQKNRPSYHQLSQNCQIVGTPSTYEDATYFPGTIALPSSRIHAYDYQLYPSSYWDHQNSYSSCSKQNVCFEQNNTIGLHAQTLRAPSRARSRSSDSRRADTHHNAFVYNLMSNNVSNVVQSSARNRNHSGSIVHEKQVWRVNIPSAPSCCGFAHVPRHRADFAYGQQQIPWNLRDNYCPVTAFPPPSPLDSGLSSQSVASSPSFETEPIQNRTPECGSPLPVTPLQRNQCSCSINSFTNSNILSPLIRTDSGRSSPWAQSAVMRLNTLTRSKTADIPHVTAVNSGAPDIDHRRYSMSGIYISPTNQNSDKSDKNGNEDYTRKKFSSIVEKSYGYEYIDDGGTLCNKKSRHFKRFQVEKNLPIKNTYNLNSSTREILKSPVSESTGSLIASNSPTDISAHARNKSEAEIQRSPKNISEHSEKALCELEEMYKKLNLQDNDLLDRAERRDLPTEHQLTKLTNESTASTLTRSKSDSFYEILGPEFCTPYRKSQRAPPVRRAGIPDVVADDMAIRKWRKSFKQHQISTGPTSYMLYSSHFTPSIPVHSDVPLDNRPDIEYDDLSYRRFFHAGTKTEDPHPPFGIPLKPLPPQSIFSDYMHVVPSSFPQPLCHPRGNPDLVRDDLAFRTLRKDDRERAMFDSFSLYYRKLR